MSQYHQNNVQAEISEVSGIDFASLASAGAPTLTEDQISQLVDALVPVARTMLPTKDLNETYIVGEGTEESRHLVSLEP